MIKELHQQWQAKVAILLFLVLTSWWIYGLQNPNFYQTRYFGDFPSIYGLMALWGAIWGVAIAKKWGGFSSIVGKALIMFSLGLFAQVFGQITYAYLSFYKNIEVPYPSIGDIGYFGSIPLYIYGVILLAQASAVKIKLQSLMSIIQAVIIPLIMLTIGYFLFLREYQFDWSNPIKIFLDFGYPLGQAIYISLTIVTYLLSRGILGGLMKNTVLFILFALSIQFFSDYTFLYQSNTGIWQVGGINDYMYLVSYFVMTLALMRFELVYKKLKQE